MVRCCLDSNTGISNPFGSESDDEDSEPGQWGGVRGVSGYHVSRLSPVRAEEEKRQEDSSRGASPRRSAAYGKFYVFLLLLKTKHSTFGISLSG